MTALVLALALVAAPADTTAAGCPGGQTLTRADVESAGAVYLSDLLRLLDAVRVTTVDGFARRPFAGGGAPFAGEAFAVLVDGVPWSTGGFGGQHLETLPVPLTEVASVAWCPEPGLAAGRWAGRGTLRIRTRADGPGTTTRLAWQIGNETGDPGPYRYTDRATLNVDKSGPDAEGALLYADSVRSGRATARVYRFYPTDLALFARAAAVTSRVIPKQRLVTAALDGSTDAFGGRIRGRIAGRYDSALWFFEPAGRELPVRRLDARLGLDGDAPAGHPALGSARLHYRLAFDTGLLADEDSDLDGFRPDWRARTWTAALEARAGRDARTTALGASALRTDADGPGLGTGAGFTLGTLYAQHSRPLGAGVTARTDLALVAAGGRARLKAAQTVRQRRGAQAFSATLAYAGRLPEEDAGYGYWAGRGYTGLRRAATPYRPLGPPEAGADLSAQVAWAGALGAALRGHLSGGLRRARGLYVERPTFSLAPGDTAVTGPVAAFPEARGTSVDARAALDGRLGSWRAHAFYSLRADIGGDAAFRDAWARVPAHRGGLALTFQPDPGFALRLAFTTQSATRWPGYTALDGAAEPRGFVYSDGTPTLRLLDVAVEKGLFDRRLRLGLAFRNVLGAEERYHPLGAPLDYRLFLRVRARFRGLPAWGPRAATGRR